MSGSTEVSARVEGAVSELDRVIRDLRNYIFGLRPGILADRQLDQALRVLGDEVQERSRIAVGVDIDPEAAAAMSPHSHEIVQLTREALSNVVRHAGASVARVRLERAGSFAVLTVEDDGVGFDPRRVPADRHGIAGLRERAAAAGGTLRITAKRGTKVVARVPA